MEKKNLIIVFDHPLSLRSYLETGILAEINKTYNLLICTIGKLDYEIKRITDQHYKFKVVQLSSLEKFMLGFYANCYWWGVANNSLSIQNRTWYQKKNKWKFIQANKLAQVYSYFFSQPPIKLSKYLLRSTLGKIKSLIENYNETKILYITSGGTTSIIDQLVNYFSKFPVSVYCIVENWDNVSSKAVFAHPAKMIGVWGEQSKKFAKKIHNIDGGQVFQIGNPRVEWLQKNVRKVESPQGIFFGGGSVDFIQESIFLLATLDIAEKFNIQVFYLPHPKCYDQARDFVSNIASKNLFCIGNFYKENTQEIAALPNLNTYLYPFNNAKIFVSSFSTLNLEAAILGIPSIAIDLHTRLKLNKNRISDRHDHIKDILDMNIFHVVNNIEDFRRIVIKLISISQSKQIMDYQKLSYLVDMNYEYIEKLKYFLSN